MLVYGMADGGLLLVGFVATMVGMRKYDEALKMLEDSKLPMTEFQRFRLKAMINERKPNDAPPSSK